MIIMYAQITFSNGSRYDINYGNMKSLEIDVFDRKDISLPNWGVISNGGKFKIVDYNGEIKALIQNNELKKETRLEVYLKNTSSNNQVCIGKMYVNEWQYDEDDKIANAKLTDGLEKMQNINITPLKRNAKNGGTKTAKQIYEYLHAQTVSNGFDMLSFEELNTKTRNHLSNYTIYLAYIDESTLWRAWKDFAEAMQLYIFKNRSGRIECVYKEGK